VNITPIAQPRRLGQPWAQEIVPEVFRVGTTFLGCFAVEDAGAYTFIDVGLPGYWPQMTRFLAARNARLTGEKKRAMDVSGKFWKRGKRSLGMTRYLISFPSGAMDHIPDEEGPEVGSAASAPATPVLVVECQVVAGCDC
jgi:hypothetical protein